MLKILGFIVANLSALVLSSVSLVSTVSLQKDTISPQLLLKLGVYILLLVLGFVLYRLGKKLLASV